MVQQQRYCPIHNVNLDPSWEVCPYCLKEGRVSAPGAAGPTVPGPPPPLEHMRVEADTVVKPGAAGPIPPAVPGVGDTRQSAAPAAAETILETPPEARAWLVVREGDGVGRWHPIGSEVSIGRDRENNIVLIEGKVSRFHAKIRLESDEEDNQQYVVWDLASRNGTWVNEERVRAPVPIKENDIVRIGSTVFVLKLVE